MGVKGCWTCRERKVRCDLHQPRCGNCTKARRFCQGYGIQLSWPRDEDKKRAITARNTPCAGKSLQINVTTFLNSSSWDVGLSDDLLNGKTSARYLRSMKVPRPLYLSPTAMTGEQSHLLDFFRDSRSLTLGPTDEKILAHFILRVAFSDSSIVANPVLQAVFALASQQLHGNSESFQYKNLVVASVKRSSDWLEEKTLLQNLMALMLLYHYELSLGSNSKGNWAQYLCAVKKVINTSPALYKLIRHEYSVLFDWIFYHEVISEFTIRHWKVPYDGCGWVPSPRSPRAFDGSISKVEDSIGCPLDVLQLLVHTCRQAVDAKLFETDYKSVELDKIQALEKRVANTVQYYEPTGTQTIEFTARHAMVAELHRLASLIYVNRAVHCISGTESRHKTLVKVGISLLTKMKTCQNAWPLFVIACEAVEDHHRLAIMDVFEQSRQDRRQRSNHIHSIQHIVEAVWTQCDLDMDQEVNYLTILDAVVGGVPFIPPFV